MLSFKAIYCSGFALGALSLIVFFLGHLGLISPPFLIAAIVVSASLFLVFLRKLPSEEEAASPVPSWHIAVMLGLVFVILPLALTPPTVRDELIQHLALPKIYLKNGSIVEVPFMGFSYLPQNMALLYLIPMGLGSDIAPRLVHLVFSVLTALSIYLYLRPKAGANFALLGFAFYIATPVVFNLSRMAYVDSAAVFFSTLSLIAALKFNEDGRARPLVYSAVSMGLALGAKYSVLPAFFLISMFIAWSASKRNGKSMEGIKAGAVYCALALLLLSPWLARNAVWKGNPFYPIYRGQAAVESASSGLVQVSESMAPITKRLVLYDEGALDLALMPVRVFFEGRDDSIERFDGVLNPIYLFLIPLAFFIRKERDAPWLGLFSALFFLIAFFTVDLVIRYLLPIVPALVCLSVLGVRNLKEIRGVKALTVTFVIAVFAFDALYTWGLYKRYRPFDFLTGRLTRAEYLGQVLADYKAVSYSNSHLPKNARVMLLLAGDRGYYWDRDYFYADRSGVFFKKLIGACGGARELKDKLSTLGLTHIFINDRVMTEFVNNNLGGRDREVLIDFFREHTELLHSANGFSTYALI